MRAQRAEATAVEESLALSLAGVEAAKTHIHKLLDERAAAAAAEIAALKAERDAALARAQQADARAVQAERLMQDSEREAIQLREDLRQVRIERVAAAAAAAAAAASASAPPALGADEVAAMQALLEQKSALLEDALICVAECQQLVLACRKTGTPPKQLPRLGHAKSAREEFMRVYAALTPEEQQILFAKIPLTGPTPPPPATTLAASVPSGSASVSSLRSGGASRSLDAASAHNASSASLGRNDSFVATGKDPRLVLWWQQGEPPSLAGSGSSQRL